MGYLVRLVPILKNEFSRGDYLRVKSQNNPWAKKKLKRYQEQLELQQGNTRVRLEKEVQQCENKRNNKDTRKRYSSLANKHPCRQQDKQSQVLFQYETKRESSVTSLEEKGQNFVSNKIKKFVLKMMELNLKGLWKS